MYLNHYGLAVQSVICLEDLMFNFGELNFSVIKLTLIGLSIVATAKLLLPSVVYESLDINTFESLRSFVRNAREIYKRYLNSGFWIKLLLGVFFISLATVIAFSSHKEIAINSRLLFLLICIYLLLPIAYIIFSSKRLVIMGFYLFSVFIASNLIIEELVKDVIKQPASYNYKISFQYHGEKIESREGLSCIFEGCQSIVLHNSITKENQIYATSDITFLSITKTKLN